MHRRPIVIANWKMHTSLAEAITLAHRYAKLAETVEDLEIVLLPPTIWLPSLVEALHHRPRNLSFGVQNIFPKLEGAFTGETGLEMVRPIARYVLVGHSERRSLFHEDNEFINQKVRAILAASMQPILCVGELTPVMLKSRMRGRPTIVERESDLGKQLKSALTGVDTRDIEKMTICYEPLWAVGSDQNVPGPHVEAVLNVLRAIVADKFGSPTAARVRTIYGGSVSEQTIGEYTTQPNIDGVLVGRASLDIKKIQPVAAAVADHARHSIQHADH